VRVQLPAVCPHVTSYNVTRVGGGTPPAQFGVKHASIVVTAPVQSQPALSEPCSENKILEKAIKAISMTARNVDLMVFSLRLGLQYGKLT
jgi:hypothetical protein